MKLSVILSCFVTIFILCEIVNIPMTFIFIDKLLVKKHNMLSSSCVVYKFKQYDDCFKITYKLSNGFKCSECFVMNNNTKCHYYSQNPKICGNNHNYIKTSIVSYYSGVLSFFISLVLSLIFMYFLTKKRRHEYTVIPDNVIQI